MYYSITATDVHTIKIHETLMLLQNKEIAMVSCSRFMMNQILALWPSALGNCIVYKRFTVQSLLSSLQFLIHHKSQARHHRSFKLGSKLKYLKKRIHVDLPAP